MPELVVDGRQRLIEFVGHAGCHFAHGDEAACGLGLFGLGGGLLFGLAALGDVGGNHHLGQAPVHPAQVARAYFQPFAQAGYKDFGVAAARSRQGVRGQAHEPIFVFRLGLATHG